MKNALIALLWIPFLTSCSLGVADCNHYIELSRNKKFIELALATNSLNLGNLEESRSLIMGSGFPLDLEFPEKQNPFAAFMRENDRAGFVMKINGLPNAFFVGSSRLGGVFVDIDGDNEFGVYENPIGFVRRTSNAATWCPPYD